MVKLVGVSHNHVYLQGGRTRDGKRLTPSNKFLRYLNELPAKSRIGIEWLPDEDWEDLEQRIREIGGDFSPGDYWGTLKEEIESKGHEVVYLEEKKPWIDIIEAQRLVAEAQRADIEHEESRPEFELYKKQIEHEEAIFWASINYRELHERARDVILKRKTLESDLELAIVGSGHSDWWIAEEGFKADEYHRESRSALLFEEMGDMEFTRNTTPDPTNLIQTTNLLRLISLRENGKLVPDKQPTFTGVYNPFEKASKNYFEVFLDDANSGTMIDTLGESRIEGIFTDRRVEFTKTYTKARPGAIKDPLKYVGCPTDPGELYLGEHFGKFTYPRGGSSFTMVNYLMKPADLALSLANSMRDKPDHYKQISW